MYFKANRKITDIDNDPIWVDIENGECQEKAEIAFRPARVLMQDYTGIPAVADLAAMRDAVKLKKIDPKKIVFSGVGKTYEEIEFAIKKKVLLINTESQSELMKVLKIDRKMNNCLL